MKSAHWTYKKLIFMCFIVTSCGQPGTSEEDATEEEKEKVIIVRKTKVITKSSHADHQGKTEKFFSDASIKGISFSRLQLQTRNPIKMEVNGSFLGGYDTFSLINLTLDEKSIIEDEPISTTDDPSKKGFQLTIGDRGGGILTVFQNHAIHKGKFTYGPNELSIEVYGENGIHNAQEAVTIIDFEIFSQLFCGFENLSDTLGSFQGWLSSTAFNQLRAEDGTSLTTGFPDIINR